MPTGPNYFAVISEHGYQHLVELYNGGMSVNEVYRWVTTTYPELSTEEATAYVTAALKSGSLAGSVQDVGAGFALSLGDIPIDPRLPEGTLRYTAVLSGFDVSHDKATARIAEVDVSSPIDLDTLEALLQGFAEHFHGEYGKLFVVGQTPTYELLTITRN